MKQVKHISQFINKSAADVYAFTSNPENLPKWASGLAGSIMKVEGDWVANSPMGEIKVRFAEANNFGVLDHDVILESGVTFHNPMRVVPNDDGCEVTFTLFQQPEMTDAKFAEDASLVGKDLKKLKSILEG